MITQIITKISFYNLFLLLQLFIASYSALQTYPIINHSQCHWTSCGLNKNPENICGPNKKIRLTEGCFVGDKKHNVLGSKYFCCLKENSRTAKVDKCAETADGTGAPDEFWWPDNEGIWTRSSINCPFAPDLADSFDRYPVRFFLFTRKNNIATDFDLLTDDEETLQTSNFIEGAPVKIITHGFLSNGRTGPVRFLREYYNKLKDPINIIAVHWEELAALSNLAIPCYNLAAQLTRLVGKRTSQIMKFLIEQGASKVEDIHVMGHSLGAHSSGFCCKEFAKYSLGKCTRLTGFDPAGPSFNNVNPAERIDYQDADFVDIIHTATTDFDVIPGIISRSIELGIVEQVGHADFYPNTGGHQPGCEFIRYPLSRPACSHGRSYEFYAESIEPPTEKVFKTTLCESVQQAAETKCTGPQDNVMGEHTRIYNGSRSIYYVETNSDKPFAKDDP